MIQQKTALEKQRLAGIAALGLQGKQGGHGVERTVDDPGCFFEKSIIQPPWPKRKPLLRRFFRGNKKSASRFSLLHSVALRLKTVHRTVFTAESPLLLPAHSNPPLSNSIKKVTPLGGITFLAEREGFEPSVPL